MSLSPNRPKAAPRTGIEARRERQRHEARRAILDATEALLAESEGGDFSIRGLAEKCGYSAPTVYYHFGDKDGLMLALLEDGMQTLASDLFSPAERAALRLARDASIVPSVVGDAHFEDLREYFDDRQIVELVAQIALFGWLNRWNDTLATPLEAGPLSFGKQHLATHGWSAAAHEATQDR